MCRKETTATNHNGDNMKSDTQTIIAQLETLQRRIAKNEDLKRLGHEERRRVQNLAAGLYSRFMALNYANNHTNY